MLYTISGEYEFFLEVRISNPKNLQQTQKSLMENSNITINAFNGQNAKLPIPCKYSWYRCLNQNQTKIPQQGNIYQCCIQDVGSNIQAIIESFDDEFTGKAIVNFNQLGISEQIKNAFQQLFKNGTMTILTQIQSTQLKWHFKMDQLVLSQNTPQNASKYQFSYPQNIDLIASNQDVIKVEFTNQYFLIEELRNLIWNKNLTLTFKSREERDLFVGVFILQKNLNQIRTDMVIQNLDKIIPGNEDTISKLFFIRLQSSQALSTKQRPFSSRQSNDDDVRDQLSQLINENNSLSSFQKQQSYMKNQMESLNKLNFQLSKIFIPYLKNQESELKSKKTTPCKEDDDERMQKMIQSLQQELKQHKQREENFKFQIEQLEQEIARSKELNSMRQSSYVVDDSQVKYLEARIEEAKRINNKLMEELKKKNQQQGGGGNQEMKQQIYQLEKENRLLKGNQLVGNDHETQNLIKINEKLMKENNDLNMKVKELEEEIDVIRALSRSQINMSQVMNRDEDLIVNLQLKISEIEKENTYLKKKIEKMQQDHSSKNNSNNNNSEINKLKEQNKKYLEENMKLFDEIRQLKDQQDMQSSVNQSGFYHLEEENLKLRKEISILKQEVVQMIQKRNKKIEELEKSTSGSNNSRLLKLEIENEKLRRDLDEKQNNTKNANEIKLLQMQNERLQQTNQRMMEENLELMNQLKQLQDERDAKSLSQSQSLSYGKWGI